MRLKDIHYSIPSTLVREQDLLEIKCNLLIEAFNQLCKEEDARIKEEQKKLLSERKFKYSIKSIKDGYLILYKEAESPIFGKDDNNQWSRPFKVINNVLVFSENVYMSKSYFKATEALGEQRILEPDFNPELLNNW